MSPSSPLLTLLTPQVGLSFTLIHDLSLVSSAPVLLYTLSQLGECCCWWGSENWQHFFFFFYKLFFVYHLFFFVNH